MFLLNLTTPFYSINNYVWIQWFLSSGRLEKTCSIGATITPMMGLKGVCFTQKEKLYWSHLLSFNTSTLTHKGSKSSHTTACWDQWWPPKLEITVGFSFAYKSSNQTLILNSWIYLFIFRKLGQMFICKPKCW